MKHRLLRVNELLKRELSGIIAREITFAEGLVSISGVDVSSDLKSAHVFVSVLGAPGGGVITQLEAHRATLQAEDFDVAIALDTATQSRLGTAAAAARSAKTWINIDHHPSNPSYGDLFYVDASAPATGQILYELISSANLPLSPAVAENLYVA